MARVVIHLDQDKMMVHLGWPSYSAEKMVDQWDSVDMQRLFDNDLKSPVLCRAIAMLIEVETWSMETEIWQPVRSECRSALYHMSLIFN